MTVVLLWGLFLIFCVFGVVWAFHMVTPWGWLRQDQLDKIQGLLTGGVIFGLVADHVKKRLN